jgi:hypothetical protein
MPPGFDRHPGVTLENGRTNHRLTLGPALGKVHVSPKTNCPSPTQRLARAGVQKPRFHPFSSVVDKRPPRRRGSVSARLSEDSDTKTTMCGVYFTA